MWQAQGGPNEWRAIFTTEGNSFAFWVAAMILVAQAQGVIWLEQPGQLILEARDRIQALWSSAVAYKRCFRMGACSGSYPKFFFCPTNHFGIGRSMERHCSCVVSGERHLQNNCQVLALKFLLSISGGPWWPFEQGGPTEVERETTAGCCCCCCFYFYFCFNLFLLLLLLSAGAMTCGMRWSSSSSSVFVRKAREKSTCWWMQLNCLLFITRAKRTEP